MRRWSRVALAVAVTAAAGAGCAPAMEPRPNILLMMADDWNWPQSQEVEDPNVRMPTFERLAREGVRFRNAFVAAPSCTPSRAALLTGRHPWELETGVHLWGALPAKFVTFTDLLEQSGYHVGYMGKGWNPGVLEETGREHNPAGRIRSETFAEFLESRPVDAPFFFWLNTGDPHRPYAQQAGLERGMRAADAVVPPILPDTPEVRLDLTAYLFEVERFDALAAETIRLLEERGELERTIVLMTSDNGMPFPRAKMTLYDLGTRVPLVVRWPARFGPGNVVDDLVSLPDLAPTFLQVARLDPPPAMTATSLLPLLTAGASGRLDPVRQAVFASIELHCGRYPMRSIRTHEYLYVRNYEPERPVNLCVDYWESEAGFSPSWLEIRDLGPEDPLYRLAAGPRPPAELYDLGADPYQLHNLAGDPGHAGVQGELAVALEAEQRRTGDPRLEGRHEEVFYVPHEANVARRRR